MAHSNKRKVTVHAPKHFKQSKEHCNIEKTAEAIILAVKENWITLEELDRVVKIVKRKCK